MLVELRKHETNLIDDPALLDFTWKIESFEEYRMKIKVSFAHPQFVSSGQERDTWVLTVKKPKFFFSLDTLQGIPANLVAEMKAPKIMPETKFTQAFVEASAGLTTITKTAMVGNFALNIVLSGSMHYLWGLIHCL